MEAVLLTCFVSFPITSMLVSHKFQPLWTQFCTLSLQVLGTMLCLQIPTLSILSALQNYSLANTFLTPKGPRPFFCKKTLKTAISIAKSKKKI